MDKAANLLHYNEETGLKYNTIKVKLPLGMPWRHLGVKGLRNNTAPNFFLIKQTDALISKFILVHNSTCFGQLPCPSPGVTFILILHASGRQTCLKCTSAELQWITPDDGQGSCPKHVELCTRINLEICVPVGFIKNICVTIHGHINVKHSSTHS